MRTRSILAATAVIAMLGGFASCAVAEGLAVDASQLPWPQLQARVGLVTSRPLGTDLVTPGRYGLQGASVLGDYYLGDAGSTRLSLAGGFRATGGVLLNSRGSSPLIPVVPRPGLALSLSQQSAAYTSPLDSFTGADNHAVPYLGVGYTGLSVKGNWGFTADVGVMALGNGNGLRAAASQTTSQTLDENSRDLHLTPVLQLGVSYSF